MELTLNGLKNREEWNRAGICLPSYDIDAAREKALRATKWIHFGIGNIFRLFLGGIAEDLLEKGLLDRGLTCVETFEGEVVERIYRPFDNLSLSVILRSDGVRDLRVIGAFAEAVRADGQDPMGIPRLMEAFTSPDLQLITFTITEKGYALADAAGAFFPSVRAELEGGPEKARGAMALVTAGLWHRHQAGARPTALVSMDNCARNGKLLAAAVRTIAREWQRRGYVSEAFTAWIEDENQVAFDSTMIDKITPRPSEVIAADLERLGLQNMQPVETARRTYIAPFANGEGPQYLVIEDRFPNGRPGLEEGFGVYMGDFDTVTAAERMKVTALLNPVHSATGPLGVVLGVELFADLISDPVILRMARRVACDEGLPLVKDPKILSHRAFVDELFEDRFPNRYLGDTNLRLSTDVSQGVGVRFGETVRGYVQRDDSAASLVAIPLGIAGWLRYMMGVDDQGRPYELAPDPMNDEIGKALSTVKWNDPASLTDQLRGILSNENVFHINLYEAGLGGKIEEMFRGMIAGPGSARRTVEQYMAE